MLRTDWFVLYADPPLARTRPGTLSDALLSYLSAIEPDGYIGIQAYLRPAQETDRALHSLRKALLERTGAATTIGYGPRYLHSTGQLHKGDGGKGVFIQLTDEITEDIPVPEQAGSPSSVYTFGTLMQAQALGDRQALLDSGRRILRIHLLGDVPTSLQKLADILRRSHD